MNRSVTPFQMEMADHPEESIHRAVDLLRAHDLIESGNPIVILSDILNREFDTDAILLRKGFHIMFCQGIEAPSGSRYES